MIIYAIHIEMDDSQDVMTPPRIMTRHETAKSLMDHLRVSVMHAIVIVCFFAAAAVSILLMLRCFVLSLSQCAAALSLFNAGCNSSYSALSC